MRANAALGSQDETQLQIYELISKGHASFLGDESGNHWKHTAKSNMITVSKTGSGLWD